MSLSEDEDDFLSADEGAPDEDHDTTPVKRSDNLKKVDKIILPDLVEKTEICLKSAPNCDEVNPKIGSKENPESSRENYLDFSDRPELSPESLKDDQAKGIDDDDEQMLAERIRDRNLKLARKFSAEIAKSVKATAPIAVKGALSTNPKNDDIEYPNIPEADIHSNPPPAPPPTPALSSSLSSEEPGISGTQYGWRLPVKNRPSCSDQPHMKSEQTRQALDRLSEQVSQSDKNLFTKVAEDLKKVSIKSGESSSALFSSDSSTIPSMSDLGGSFSGWNWSNATKLLASASQVTSQVSSVLDTVSQHLQSTGLADQSSTSNSSPSEIVQAQGDVQGKLKSDKVSMSATEAVSNDAFVDLTLNAMESLGKKAFCAMTERDESGSLQIKGLGRPWEHLLNMKRAQEPMEPPSCSRPLYDEEPATPSTSYGKKEAAEDKQPSSLKNRKKNCSYADDDKLD